jgi:hypothetical protein
MVPALSLMAAIDVPAGVLFPKVRGADFRHCSQIVAPASTFKIYDHPTD